MRHPIRVLTLIVALAACAGIATADADRWRHGRVDGHDGEKGSVNLVPSLVEAALAMIPDEHFQDGDFVLDDIHWGHGHHMSVEELRALWNELKSSPDMTFVTVEESDETVRVSKNGGYLLINTEEHGDNAVEVRVPLTVVDALLSGEGESLDIRAAIEALAEHGEGELVAVSERDEQVRVWIDRTAESD